MSSSSSSSSTSSSSSSASSISQSSESISSSSSSSSSIVPYQCDDTLLAVAHWPNNNVYIYSMMTWALIKTVACNGEYPDAVGQLDGDLIVGDSLDGEIDIHIGETSAVSQSLSAPRITGMTIASGDIWHCALAEYVDYPVGIIYHRDGTTAAISEQFYSPDEAPHALAFDGTNLISLDKQRNRIYIHTGLARAVSSYYATQGSDCRGICVNACSDLLEYDATEKKLYIHDGTTSTIQATIDFDIEFTGIGTPQTGCPAPDTYGLNRGGYNLMTSGGIQEQTLSSSSSSSSST